MTTFLEIIKTFVGFGPDDARVLREFKPFAQPHLERIADRFYRAIALDPDANAVMRGGAPQVERLKRSLVHWLATGLEGPHDETYHRLRTRIGRVHVRINLPQRYMLTAMNVVRNELHTIADASFRDEPDRRHAVDRAVDRLLDIELAIMLETYKEDSETQLRRQERLASMGQFAGMIGHELRNPLGVIETSLYLVRQRIEPDPKTERHLDKIGAQVANASRVVSDLLDMTRDRAAARQTVGLSVLLDEALANNPVFPEGVDLHRRFTPQATLYGEPSLLVRALENLIRNAVEAIGPDSGGNIWVELSEDDYGDDVLSVRDDGPGLSAEILPRALEPLVTSRPSGVGLGLTLVRNVCVRHGGSAEVANHPQGGAVVRMRLPSTPSGVKGTA